MVDAQAAAILQQQQYRPGLPLELLRGSSAAEMTTAPAETMSPSTAQAATLSVLQHLHQQQRQQICSNSDEHDEETLTPTSTSSLSPSGRHKCSLAFILATSDAASSHSNRNGNGDDEDRQYTTPTQHHQNSMLGGPPLSFAGALLHPGGTEQFSVTIPNAVTTHSNSNRTSTHTPTNERVKMKRRRAPSSTKTTPVSGTSSKQKTDPLATTNTASSPLKKKGSKFCVIEGCESRAKHARRCWKHGGSVKCKVPDCVNRAKTKGVCWSHGGGTICSFAQCGTISVSNGVCWAHGGGKRCAVEGCSRPAYERTENLCTLHFDDKQKIALLAGKAK